MSHSEEDTFNRLRRTPISELDSEYQSRFLEFYSNTSIFEEWLEEHGWKADEFFAAGSKFTKEQDEKRKRHLQQTSPT